MDFFLGLRTPLYRKEIYLVLNTIVANALGFFFWMVVARYYTPYEVGLAAIVIPTMAFISTLSVLEFRWRVLNAE